MTMHEMHDSRPGGGDDDVGALELRRVAATVLPDQTLKRKDAALLLGVRPATLARWAARREGPPYFRCQKFVFYRLSDLRDWKAKHSVERLPKQPDLL
jgi:hypothetical protein